MRGIDFQHEMVGREQELNELKAHLDRAAEGQGSTLFVSGEAGIGKTRLVDELKNEALSKGFQILTGNSMFESLTPYMPFIEALKSGGLEPLFAEEAPRVETVYLVTNTGLLIKEVIRQETGLDPDVFASMLTTVSHFVKDAISMLKGEEEPDGELNTLGYKDHRILIKKGKNANLVVIISGRENEFLIDDMNSIISDVERAYGNVITDWTGDEDDVKGIEKLLQPLITSGKFEGIYYGKDNPKARRNLLFENVSMGVIRHASNMPTLLCIEDLQWADPSTLALLHYVARNGKSSNLLILGTYRPEDVVVEEGLIHPLMERLRLMNREDLYRQIELGRLSKENILEIMAALLSEIELSDDFKERLYSETEGNPLFMIELIKLMVEDGTIDRDNGSWMLTRNVEDMDIPKKIYDVISRRLNRVEGENREILDCASVVGEEFTSNLISSALDITKMNLLKELRTLEQKHRLIHSHNGNYRFDHAKIKEVLYTEIPPELRMEYHAIIASFLENFNLENLDKVFGNLAFHYLHSKNREKALEYLKKAAEKAKGEYSNSEAIRFFNNALELEEDPRKRSEIFDNLGDVYTVIGDYDMSIESFKSAMDLSDATRERARIAAKIGDTYRKMGDYRKAIEVCTEAHSSVKGEDCQEESNALHNLGIVYYLKGEYGNALEHYQKSLAIKERIGFEVGTATSLSNIGIVHCDEGDYGKGLECFEKALALFEKIGGPWGIGATLNSIGSVYYNRADFQRAREYYERCLAIFEKTGDQDGIGAALNNIGTVQCDLAKYDSALETMERSLTIKKKIGDQRGIATTLHNIGIVNFEKGEFGSALENFHKSLEIERKIGDQRGMTHNYDGIAEIHFKNGDLTKATEFCDRALELAKEIGHREKIADSMRIFGMIYRTQKKWGESIENFEKSIDIFKEMGMDKELGESHYEFGLMWKEKDDPQKAKENLNIAGEIFEGLKLSRMVELVKRALL